MLRRLRLDCAVRQGLSFLLLSLFALRALVPPGYMPDALRSISPLPFKLVVCRASSWDGQSPFVTLDRKAPGDSRKDHGQPCALGGLLAFADPQRTLLDIVSPIGVAAETVRPQPMEARPRRPPLGSRGPPIAG